MEDLTLEEIIEELDVFIPLVEDLEFMKSLSVEDRHYIASHVLLFQEKYREHTDTYYFPVKKK